MNSSNEILQAVNQYLDQLPYERQPRSLYEPSQYVLSLGGKRIRPVLMLLAYNMFKDDPAVGTLAKGALVRLIMERFGVTGGECVLVGDTRSDFVAAKENGIESVGVTWGYGTPEELALADRVVGKASEI